MPPCPSVKRQLLLRGRISLRARQRLVERRGFATGPTQHPEIYDVVVLGGGPAGLSIAAALRSASSQLKIGLIESNDLSKSAKQQRGNDLTSFSNRCSSLTPASVRFLQDIGAWHHVDAIRVQPYTRMNVWDGITGSRLTFDWASTHGLSAFSGAHQATNESSTIAYMIENANLTSALLSRLSEHGDEATTLFSPSRVEAIELGKDSEALDLRSWPILRLSDGQTMAARLLIGADGPNSIVRTFAGINSKGWDYERHGVVATLRRAEGSAPIQPTAFQRFLPTGPCALLPMPNGHASLVWSTTPQRAALLKSLSETDFVAMVNAAFRLSAVDLEYMHGIPSGQADELAWRTQHTPFDPSLVPGAIASVQAGSIASFPLKMRHADTYTGERVALAGDAAHTIHPLAGQGLNLGLADAKSLARVIANGAGQGADIGSTLSLEAYAAERYAANHIMMGVCDKLHKAYSWSSGPVVWARDLGFNVVENWGWLKGRIMEAAKG